MDEIISLLTSPAFWFGGILVAILANVISHYITPRTDSLLSRWEARRRRASKKKQRIFEERVQELLKQGPEEAMRLELQANQAQTRGFFMLLAALIIIGYAETFDSINDPRINLALTLGGVLVVFIAFTGPLWLNARMRAVLAEYDKRKAQEREEDD